MPKTDKHAPGTFCWVELATSDQNAAKSFYGSLFGWSVKDIPMGPDAFYSMFQLDSSDAAAAYTIRAEQRAQGVPPHWMLYIAVQSADDVTQRAAKLGGKVLAPAFDVFDLGRMAVLQDPTGATFSVWQPKQHAGTGIGGVDGTLCWADLSTPNQALAGKFYSGLFGWTIATEDEGGHGYFHIKKGEEFIGGIPPATHRDPNTPPHWVAYFLVSDCDATAAKAKELGARLYVPPTSFEEGRFAVLADPQGAVFAIFQALRHT
jgi:uncharacterized protein